MQLHESIEENATTPNPRIFTLKANVEMMDSCRVMTRLGLLALGTLLWANTYCWVCLCMSTPLWKDSLSPWMSNLGLLALQKDPLVCLWKQTPSVWIWRGTPHPFNSVFAESLTLGVSDPIERWKLQKGEETAGLPQTGISFQSRGGAACFRAPWQLGVIGTFVWVAFLQRRESLSDNRHYSCPLAWQLGFELDGHKPNP